MRNYIILALLILSFNNGFAQDNPYDVFGHESKVKYETKLSEYLTVKNTDTNSATKFMVFNMNEGVIFLIGNNDTILKSIKIEPEKLLRFLSVDPLTKDFPWYTPYQFAGNKVIMATDLDGLEERVVIYDNSHYTGQMQIITNCKWSDLFPGQKHGPLGTTGTVILIKNINDTWNQERRGYAQTYDGTYTFMNQKNILISEKFKLTILPPTPRELTIYEKFKKLDEGLSSGSNPTGTNGFTIPENGSVSLGGEIAAGWGLGGSIEFAWDKKGGKSLLLSGYQACGYSVGVGIQGREYNSENFSIKDLKGSSESVEGSVFIYSAESITGKNSKGKTSYTGTGAGIGFGATFVSGSYKVGTSISLISNTK